MSKRSIAPLLCILTIRSFLFCYFFNNYLYLIFKTFMGFWGFGVDGVAVDKDDDCRGASDEN